MSGSSAFAEEKMWIAFSALDKEQYSLLMSGFSVVCGFIMQPLVVLTVRQQALSSATNPSSTSKYLLDTYREIGIRGLYRGFLPLALAGMPTSVVYGLVFEMTRENIRTSLNTYAPSLSPTQFELLSALASSTCSNSLSLLCYVPGEIVASRMIVQSKDGLSMTQMLWHMRRAPSGLTGFYRGYSSSLAASIVSCTAWWSAYSLSRKQCASYEWGKRNVSLLDGCAGTIAGIASAAFSHPMDTLKTRIMTGVSKERNMGALLIRMAREKTLFTLWKGFMPSLYQASLSSCGFAVAYELIKRNSSSSTSH